MAVVLWTPLRCVSVGDVHCIANFFGEVLSLHSASSLDPTLSGRLGLLTSPEIQHVADSCWVVVFARCCDAQAFADHRFEGDACPFSTPRWHRKDRNDYAVRTKTCVPSHWGAGVKCPTLDANLLPGRSFPTRVVVYWQGNCCDILECPVTPVSAEYHTEEEGADQKEGDIRLEFSSPAECVQALLWATREKKIPCCFNYPSSVLSDIESIHSEEPETPTATSVGQYAMEGPLGSGNNSFVYKGKHTSTGLAVALKWVADANPHLARELAILHCDGSFKPKLHAVYSVPETHSTVLALDLLGRDLFGVVSKRFNPSLVPAVSLMMLRSLRAFHTQFPTGVHGSLKPENFCFSGEAAASSQGPLDLILIDFGRSVLKGPAPLELDEPYHGWWYSDWAYLGFSTSALDDLESLVHSIGFMLSVDYGRWRSRVLGDLEAATDDLRREISLELNSSFDPKTRTLDAAAKCKTPLAQRLHGLLQDHQRPPASLNLPGWFTELHREVARVNMRPLGTAPAGEGDSGDWVLPVLQGLYPTISACLERAMSNCGLSRSQVLTELEARVRMDKRSRSLD